MSIQVAPPPGVYSSFVADPSFFSFGTILVPQQPSLQPHPEEKMLFFSLEPIPSAFLFSLLSAMIITSVLAGFPLVSILFELLLRRMGIKFSNSTKIELS
ncbi:MAG: hypothetical protein WBJ51_00235 [Methanoculleus sp.]|jgi:hypothetical protein